MALGILDVEESVSLLKPDLIILDLAMPLLNGVEEASVVTRRTTKRQESVAFSMFASELGKAIRSATKIDAVVSKSSGLKDLVDTIHRLLDMQPPLQPPNFGSPQSCSTA